MEFSDIKILSFLDAIYILEKTKVQLSVFSKLQELLSVLGCNSSLKIFIIILYSFFIEAFPFSILTHPHCCLVVHFQRGFLGQSPQTEGVRLFSTILEFS